MHIGRKKIEELAVLVRYFSIRATTAARSGHLTSSLSATDLMTTLMFGGFFHADLKHPEHPLNDRLIFSKGHAAPLLYSLYTVAGAITEQELVTLRQLESRLEGHPTMQFPFTEAPTGSLGQGLSIGVGLALAAKYLDEVPTKTFVLLGDSEMAEGSNWEAMNLAVHYKLGNLVAILDVNRLGQRGETMFGHDVAEHERRAWAFGWKTIVVDGHDVQAISDALAKAVAETKQPVMIIAKTIKGKGVAFIEDKEGWHGKALSPAEAEQAVLALKTVNVGVRGMIPHRTVSLKYSSKEQTDTKVYDLASVSYGPQELVATRKAYGPALCRLASAFPKLVVLDAETSNSTGAEAFKHEHPKRFFEMFIAEQNMVGAAVGLARRGYMPFVSTFAAFFSRAHDQIRMAQYANVTMTFVGSHAGVSIGEDGASQMGLEDIALFRGLLGSTVLYPSDATSADKLVEVAAHNKGITYIRTTRRDTPVLYRSDELFIAGGSKTLRSSTADVVTIVSAGVTVHETLKACDELHKQGIAVRVIDAYSVKPLDGTTLEKAARDTGKIVVVEDHFVEGGLGEAVKGLLASSGAQFEHLAVTKVPHSGASDELLAYSGIDALAIVAAVKKLTA